MLKQLRRFSGNQLGPPRPITVIDFSATKDQPFA